MAPPDRQSDNRSQQIFDHDKTAHQKHHECDENQAEILLDKEIAKNRIMGRRLCVNDNNHPNNIFIDAIKPDGDKCRVCGGELKTRADDQDEDAISKRHSIYYDASEGTLASAYYFKDLAAKEGKIKYIELDGKPGVKDVTEELVSKL